MGAVFGAMVPMIYLSGLIFPIENMPPAIQVVTYAIPLRYYAEIIRGVFLRGSGIAVLWPRGAHAAADGHRDPDRGRAEIQEAAGSELADASRPCVLYCRHASVLCPLCDLGSLCRALSRVGAAPRAVQACCRARGSALARCGSPGRARGGRLAPRGGARVPRAHDQEGRLRGSGAVPRAARRRERAGPRARPSAAGGARAPPRHRHRRSLARVPGQPAGRPARRRRHRRPGARRPRRTGSGVHRPRPGRGRGALGLLAPDGLADRRLVRRAARPLGPRPRPAAAAALRTVGRDVVAVARAAGARGARARGRPRLRERHDAPAAPSLPAHADAVGRAAAGADLAGADAAVDRRGGRAAAAVAGPAPRGPRGRALAARRGRDGRARSGCRGGRWTSGPSS